MNKWFQTWKRPEYQEWATPIPEGYLLVIIRKEQSIYLCVKALLKMKEKGLPEFLIREQLHHPTKQDAMEQISLWQNSI